jgi:peptide/nickel transport system substrate-binding protein
VQGPGSLTGLTLPSDQSYLTSATEQYTATYDAAQAKQILTKAGWKMGSNGFFELGGKPLAFSIEDPSAYTDFITDDQIMSAELKKVGMDVTVTGTSVQKWTTDLNDGTFQSIAHWWKLRAHALLPVQQLAEQRAHRSRWQASQR